jgi:branched-chain amino acid transport system ATP-binding protein
MSEILKITNLKLNYGPITAIKGIDISVEKGQIVAILGANGAGKTSTLKVISGLLKPAAGEIIFDGNKVSGKPAHVIAKQGIMQSPEGRHVLIGLTVEENLRVGGYNIKSKEELQRNFERVYNLFPRLKGEQSSSHQRFRAVNSRCLLSDVRLWAHPSSLFLMNPPLDLLHCL